MPGVLRHAQVGNALRILTADGSDLTGRIWRIRYVGGHAPATLPLRPAQWTEEAFLIDALGSAETATKAS